MAAPAAVSVIPADGETFDGGGGGSGERTDDAINAAAAVRTRSILDPNVSLEAIALNFSFKLQTDPMVHFKCTIAT